MLKTLGAQIREFKKDSLLTPVFMILEVFMETIIPLMMASIIDQGVEAGNIHHIYVMGAWMVVAACFSLFCGVMGGKYGARASAGFARNLRKAMYENIQSFSFSNIDKFSTAGLVTRLTTDVTNLQNAYQMLLRMCVRGADQSDLRDVHGVFHQPRDWRASILLPSSFWASFSPSSPCARITILWKFFQSTMT